MVIDGLDGSGKSTQARIAVSFLKERGKTVLLRVHPEDDNFFGVKTRQFLYSQGKNAHFAAALFYMMDVIRSILLYSWRSFDYVLFVRYLMGTAYLPPPLHKIGYHFFAFVVPKSEIMLFLDVTPEEAARRIGRSRNKQEMFEEVGALRKIRPKALSLAYLGNWIIIDANEPANKVAHSIESTILTFEKEKTQSL